MDLLKIQIIRLFKNSLNMLRLIWKSKIIMKKLTIQKIIKYKINHKFKKATLKIHWKKHKD